MFTCVYVYRNMVLTAWEGNRVARKYQLLLKCVAINSYVHECQLRSRLTDVAQAISSALHQLCTDTDFRDHLFEAEQVAAWRETEKEYKKYKKLRSKPKINELSFKQRNKMVILVNTLPFLAKRTLLTASPLLTLSIMPTAE